MRTLLARWFTPAPDSAAACSMREGKSPWADAVHLLWTVWVLFPLLFEKPTWTWAALLVLSYPVFLLLYARLVVAPARKVVWYTLAMAALGLALLPWFDSSTVYFMFGCITLCRARLEFRQLMLILFGLNGLLFVESWLLHYPFVAVAYIPITSVVVSMVIRVEGWASRKNAELRLSHEEVRRLAATAERERIGRDLHDLLGHTLSLITLKLELSRKLHGRGEDAASRREADEAETIARQALAEVRAAVTGIRATDLAAELASARLLLESSGVHLEYGALPIGLPAELERGLALVLREAATNIARHAHATRASVALSRDGAQVALDIADDGRGGIEADGNGLCGMRERVRSLGGSLQIEAPKGQGTRLSVRVPVPSAVPILAPTSAQVVGSAA